MGCFSFMCKNTNKPALSTSFDGTACHMFLLKNGKVVEEMFGNYNSYGRVFNQESSSYEWKTEWGDVCDLMFSCDKSNGIALILTAVPITENIPTTRSEDDPNQGWGDGYELLGTTAEDLYETVENPFHKIHTSIKEHKKQDFEKRAFILASGQVLCTRLPENYDEEGWYDEETGYEIDEWIVHNAWEPFQHWSADRLWDQIDSTANTIKDFHKNEMKLSELANNKQDAEVKD